LVAKQMPREGATAKGIDLVPAQMPTPGTDRVPRRTTAAAAECREGEGFHLVQMEDPFDAGDQREDAGQQTLSQRAVFVCETLLGRGQPIQGLRHQEERARVLGPRREKGGGDGATVTVSIGRGSTAARSTLGFGAFASARVARSRPNFLQKWCKATVETCTSQVRLMKSMMS